MLRHLVGLPVEDARRCVRQALFDDGAITMQDVDRTTRLKHSLLGAEGVLTIEPDTARFHEVGGLGALKHWLELRRGPFLDVGGETGLDAPKGVLLLGVQGGGKSLAAKAVAGSWNVPLVRLDFATLYNKYYGETERNLRQALKAAEAMAPCVLWIDEIEKGLAVDDGADGGLSRRVLGTLLTWMAERDAPRVSRGDRERREPVAARAAAQGPLRRDLLRRPARRCDARGDLPDPPRPPEARARGVRRAVARRRGRRVLRRRDRAGGRCGGLRGARGEAAPRRRARRRGAGTHQAALRGDGRARRRAPRLAAGRTVPAA